jgi:hypothetical protein
MTNTVYVVGAGINQVIKHRSYNGISPPMINNFFQVALKMRNFASGEYTERIKGVYDYIYRYWKKDKSRLADVSFDIEECFTTIELHLNEAIKSNNIQKANELYGIQFRLKLFLAEVLHEFEIHAPIAEIMRPFGIRLHAEKPVIISFNYDNFLEIALESSSGWSDKEFPSEAIVQRMHKRVRRSQSDDLSNEVSDDELDYHNYNWTRRMGYDMRFDVVRLEQAGVREYVDGNRFYSRPSNKLYPWYILKLHGSINWFRYLPIPSRPTVHVENKPILGRKEKQIILDERFYQFNEPVTLHGWVLDPLIITPTLYKEAQISQAVYEKITILWEKAKSALSNCKRLIIIEYSFPPTDFGTKKLFLEAFSNHHLDELIVVNPDTSTIQKVKDMCHFRKPVIVCSDLTEFLNNAGS